MTIEINQDKCMGCPNRDEGRCERICPGGLIVRKKDKALIEYPEDCWDCAACIKACPVNAIEMVLPPEIGCSESSLVAETKQNKVIWLLKKSRGEKKEFITQG
ncbi:4Fe-4S dicluster domain-containing protein [Halanaerobaculum tunisiense]